MHHSQINMLHKKDLEKQLDDLYEAKAKGAQVRSRAKWIDEGEKNTSYFLRLENKHQSHNVINKIMNNNKTYYDTAEILNQLCVFYEDLYSSKNIPNNEINDYLNEITLPNTLSQEDKEMCDIFPSIAECAQAVFNMKNNKAPGSDGLPVEFYKMFWKQISEPFYNALKSSFAEKELSVTQKCSILSLIHKKGDIHDLGNYRPISLTNCDYKIIACVFARRLQKIIDNLINKDQTGYIKGRYIGNNARLIMDIFDYCENNKETGILLFADFQKAFDSVEWDFLFKTLNKFNFGDNFISWIKILYTNPYYHIKNNGWLSRKCKMKRGIRQGCPVSAILFLFVMEILHQKITNTDSVTGFKLDNMESEIKCLQHADDSTFPIKDKDSLYNAIELIKNFGAVSGTKLNISKTECILFGKLKNEMANKTHIHEIRINTDSVKCLGIFIGQNKISCNEKNWLNKLKEFEKILDSWRTRKLSLFGKCQIVNSLILSKLLYTSAILEYPDKDFIKNLNKIIFSFLWNKRERIKRKTLIRSTEEGGIGIMDFEMKIKAIKASWIPKLLVNKNSLGSLLNACLEKHYLDIPYLLSSTATNTKHYSLKYLPNFYKEIFCAFNECKSNGPTAYECAMKENIWFNRNICDKGKPLFFQAWNKSGYRFVKDLYDVNGFKSIHEIKQNLSCSKNYLCEYVILKKALKSYNTVKSLQNIHTTDTSINMRFNFHGILDTIDNKKSKFFYKILLSKNSQKPLMENYWTRLFKLESTDFWEK